MFSSNCINEMYGKIFVMLIGNGGATGNVFISNYLVHVGRYTYISTEHGKDLNDVEQYLQGLTGTGHLLALYYNVFPTISFLQTAQDDLNTTIIAIQSGNTMHLPMGHASVSIFLFLNLIV